MIDTWGRGIQKVYSACKEAGLPEPEIKEFQNGLLVTLFGKDSEGIRKGFGKSSERKFSKH